VCEQECDEIGAKYVGTIERSDVQHMWQMYKAITLSDARP